MLCSTETEYPPEEEHAVCMGLGHPARLPQVTDISSTVDMSARAADSLSTQVTDCSWSQVTIGVTGDDWYD